MVCVKLRRVLWHLFCDFSSFLMFRMITISWHFVLNVTCLIGRISLRNLAHLDLARTKCMFTQTRFPHWSNASVGAAKQNKSHKKPERASSCLHLVPTRRRKYSESLPVRLRCVLRFSSMGTITFKKSVYDIINTLLQMQLLETGFLVTMRKSLFLFLVYFWNTEQEVLALMLKRLGS